MREKGSVRTILNAATGKGSGGPVAAPPKEVVTADDLRCLL